MQLPLPFLDKIADPPACYIAFAGTESQKLTEGYKFTEVGVIPNDWDVGTVGESFEICNHLRFPISQEVRATMCGEYPYYGPTKVQDYINEYRVEGEYVLIGEDGDHFLKWRELPMTLLVNGKFNVNNHAHLIRGTRNLTKWFYFYFYHKELTPYLTRQGVGRYKLTKSMLANIAIPLPPIDEQARIVEILDAADAAVRATENLIEAKIRYKRALAEQLLTGKCRFPEFAGQAWRKMTVGDVVLINARTLPENTSPDYMFSYIDLSAVREGVITMPTTQIKFNEAPSRARRCIRRNDVLIATVRPYLQGFAYISWEPQDTICSTGFAVLTVKEGHDARYVYQWAFTQEATRQFAQCLAGSSFPAISAKDVENIRLRIPQSRNEEKRIADALGLLDAEIALLRRQLDAQQKQKQGLTQKLLTGQVRVKEFET